MDTYITTNPTVTQSVRFKPANKSLAQHFLVDQKVLKRIVKSADISPGDMVIEVGPGRGIMTKLLSKCGASVIAIEIDRYLVSSLTSIFKDDDSVKILSGDARKINLVDVVPSTKPYKVVANLPYYAAAPIIRRFLQTNHKPQLMVVMLQREVAKSMAAPQGKMGLMSVATQLYGEPRIVSYVPPRAFHPSPKVTSAILRIDVHPKLAVDCDSEDDFFKLVRAGFSSPRKQIRNSLRHGLSISSDLADGILSKANLDPKRRPQTLSLKEWAQLYNSFSTFSIHTEQNLSPGKKGDRRPADCGIDSSTENQ